MANGLQLTTKTYTDCSLKAKDKWDILLENTPISKQFIHPNVAKAAALTAATSETTQVSLSDTDSSSENSDIGEEYERTRLIVLKR